MPKVILPTLHSGQVDIWKGRGRFNVVCCGRRWGEDQDDGDDCGGYGAEGISGGVIYA